MFRFANPFILYFLVLIPILIFLFIVSLRSQKKRLKQFGNPKLLGSLMPNYSKSRPRLKFILLISAMTLMILALARPQFGSELKTETRKGVEAIFVLDVSKSMLAEDLVPSRIEYAKRTLSKLVDNMVDNKVGLIVFAGDAYVLLPMTADNVSTKMLLSTIQPNMVPRSGTAIGSALDLAIRSFGSETSEAGRTIILMTDGENHEDDAIAAATLAAEKGIIVNVIGIGSPKGEPIPIGSKSSFLKDKSGNVVITKLNEGMCRQIADAGKGVYMRSTNSNLALRTLKKEIDKMQKGELKSQSYAQYSDRFYILAWIALLLLLLDFCVLYRKNQRLNRIHLFD